MNKTTPVFYYDLYAKVLYFEWALLLICGIAEAFALTFAPPDLTAPDLRVSLIILSIVGLLSLIVPTKGSYWDRFCFLLLELMLITGATAAGLARFLFPLFVIVVAKSCLLLDRRGMLLTSFGALVATITWAAFKIHLQWPWILAQGFTPRAVLTLITGSLIYVYVALVLMVLVAMLTTALQGEKRSRLETERLSKEVQGLATELERSRIAREIHDSLGHTLTSLNIQLDVARRLQDREPERCAEAINTAKELASQSLTDVRMALQSIRNNSDFNFKEAVNGLVKDVQQAENKMDVQLNLNVTDVPASVGFQLYRVIQECMTNVLKHANASEVRIALDQSAETLTLQVSDNGCGLNNSQPTAGFGILGMQERIQGLNGTVAISAAPNQGTNIEVQIPLKPVETTIQAS